MTTSSRNAAPAKRYGYKVLDANGGAIHGKGKWHLPVGRKPGAWMPPIKNPELCARGYHFCRDTTDLLTWLNETIWIVEVRGAVIEGNDKVVASEARLVRKVTAWNEQNARLFAVACAKRALKYADPKYVDVAVLKNTIRVAGLFAVGKASQDELSAAGSAARSVAESAAWSAAGSAAGSAARSAAGSAAWSAARSAAWSAARSAAWSAARSVAGSAARSAARSAEEKWQARKLEQLLKIKVRS